MRKLLFAASFSIFGLLACGQIQWNKATNWRLYQIDGHRLFKIPLDSLKLLSNAALSQDSINFYLTTVEKLHPKGPIAWMGGYVATCDVDGKTRKVEISYYAGYFFDESERSYYQLPLDKTASWNSYLLNVYLALLQKSR